MDYKYSIVIDEKTLVDSISLDKALQFVFMFTQLVENRSIMIWNNDTNEVVLEYLPGNCSFYDAWVSDKIKEI